MAELFYTNKGLITSTRSEYMQWEFDSLADLFDRENLRENTIKTVEMI